jgi:hypothetical protein
MRRSPFWARRSAAGADRRTPIARVREGLRKCAAAADELFWRPTEASTWRRDIATGANGACELAWLDRTTGHIRDHRDAVILPRGCEISSRRIGDWHEIRLSGWAGAAAATAASPHGSGCWRLPAKGKNRSWLLNALIASEEERLKRWTRPFGGEIRFALYNGLMQDRRQSERDKAERDHPEQVLYRTTLRVWSWRLVVRI